MKRGEIYYIESTYRETGSEQRGGRPAVIVSNDKNNENSEVVEVVYMTTKPKNDLPMRILRAPQSRAFCNFKSLHHAERKEHKQTDRRTVKNLYAPHGLPGSVYEQRERLRALQITERRSSQ